MFKSIKRHLKKRFKRFYHPNRWHLILDISLITIIVILLISAISLHYYQPNFDLSEWIIPKHPQVDLSNPPLEISFETETTAIRLEDNILASIYLKNNGDFEINDLKFTLSSKNNNFDISRIEIPSDYEIDERVIEVNNSELLLDKMEPGEEFSTDFKIYFKTKKAGVKSVDWQIDSEYDFYRQQFKKNISLPEIKIASTLKMEATAYYNSSQGDQLGSGPLPPIVSLPTNFWIFFEANPGGNFKELVMSARLPKNVTFTDNSSLLAGSLNYNSDSRQIIWKIETLKIDENNYRAGFEVQLIPLEDQVGKEANLLEDLRFQAVDSWSNLKEKGSIRTITTSLDNDLINKGLGIVLVE